MILHIVQADRAQTGLDGVVSMSGVVSHASREQLREFICRGDSAATVGHDAPLLHERLQTFSCSGLGNTKSGGNVVKIGRAIRKQLQNFFQRGTGFGFALSAGNRRPAIGFHRSDDCCDEELWWGKCAAASSSNTVGIPVATASTRRPSFVRRCLYISTNWRLRAEVSSMVPNAPTVTPSNPPGLVIRKLSLDIRISVARPLDHGAKSRWTVAFATSSLTARIGGQIRSET